MGFLANALNVAGVVLLTHAVYSAHEHSLLSTALPSASAAPTLSSTPSSTSTAFSYILPTLDLPLDVTLETLVSVLLICVGIVLGSPELKPIQWRVWAGKLEREKSKQNKDELGPRGNPYAALEQRAGFLDIRRARGDFAAWVKEGAKVEEKFIN
ncbi:hypothetical protein AAFC00_005557 [Neodothiora populina]|uniref:Magnesium transporter n=1 Tax=Neodothiora populina TaxID=2781224 RepID=A0ABR3PLA0_9PEZI